MQRGFLLRADDRSRKRGARHKKSKSSPQVHPPSQPQPPQQQQQQPHSHRRREIIVSQDLITLEKVPTETTPSLLLVPEQTHDDADHDQETLKPSTRPLISIIDAHDEGDTTTTRSTSDIVELPTPAQPLVTFMETSRTFTETEEFLFQERTTIYSSVRGQRVAMEPNTELSTPVTNSIPVVKLRKRNENNAAILEDSSLNGIGTTPTLLDFQQMLARMKWKDDESIDVDAAVAKWSPDQAIWAWQWLLNLDGKTHHLLLHSLFYHHPWTIPHQLKNDTAQDRAQSLQLLKWIQDYLTTTQSPRPNHSSNNLINLPSVDDWLNSILASLSTFIDHRRTILAQQAWTTSILIIAKFASNLSLTPSNTLDHLLSIQIQWKQAKKASPKTQAQITLLQHWIQVNKMSFDRQDQATWRRNVLGIHLQQYLGFGGLVHLFCRESLPSDSRDGDDLSEEVWDLLGSSLKTKDGTTVSILWRGILAHLSTVINHLDNSAKRQTMDKILDLLPEIYNQSDCEVAVAILQLIWSDNGGLAVDVASFTGPALPKAMERVWSCISESEVKEPLDAQHEALDPLFSFLAQSIIRSPNSVAIVKNLLSREGITISTCRILRTILTNLNTQSSPIIPNDEGNGAKASLQAIELRDHVQNIMINNIPTSSSLREYWQSCDYNTESLHQSVPNLLELLYKYRTQTDELSSDTVATVSSILTKVLECCIVHQNLGEMVNKVVTFLVTAETSSSKNSATDFSNGAFCRTFCTKWRGLLLNNTKIPDDSFADTVLAVASAVCDHPSSVATLAFFGALMGDQFPSLEEDSKMSFRIMLAMESFLSFCGSNLKEPVRGSDSILNRLSPLLLLRRVPAAYFTVGRLRARNLDSSRIQDSSLKVEQYIGSIFELPWADCPRFPVTPEERRLAAEVAGRSFAFGGRIPTHPPQLSRPFTTFAWICWPIFTELIQEVRTNNLKPMQIPLVKRARLALYTACHSIQKETCQDEEPYDHEYYKTASFAFYAVCIDLTGLVDDVANEIIQLQRGCIEFFAICFAQFLTDAKLKESNRCRTGSSVKHLEHNQPVTKASEPFSRIWQAIVNILQTNHLRSEDEWICSTEIDHGNPGDDIMTKPSVQSRTCLWNALALVAQRCDDNGSLTMFAEFTLRWIVEWATQQTSSESNVYHPMCSAAAMQVVFITITRSKSIDCLHRDGDSKNNIKLLYLWALRHLQNSESGKEMHHMLSMAALKLILALLTLASMISTTGSEASFCLDFEEINKTVATLQRRLKTDVEDDARGLSLSILSVLQVKAQEMDSGK